MIFLLRYIKNYKFYTNRELIIVSIFVAIVILCIFGIGITFVSKFATGIFNDSFYYLEMSYAPFQSSVAPYMYRLLTPVLVYLLPFNHMMGFTLINLTGLFGTAILFYYYLKKLNFNKMHCFFGVIFFISAPTVIYSMYDIALVDILSFLFFLLAFYAILCKNDKLYLFALILGVLNKETILFTLPLYFLCKNESKGLGHALKKTLLMALVPLVLFISIRYFFGFTSYFSITTVKETVLYALQMKRIFDLRNPFLAFGTLWILSLYAIKFVGNSFLKKSLCILPLIFLQILIATDISRSLFIAFPIIIPISLYLFKIKDNIRIFVILSFLILFSYILLVKGYSFLLVFVPLEITIFSALFAHYLSIKGILKPLI